MNLRHAILPLALALSMPAIADAVAGLDRTIADAGK